MKKCKAISVLLVLAMLLSVMSMTAFAADSSVTLFSGSVAATAEWSAVVTAYTPAWGGTFDPATVTEGGAFVVTYTGTAGKLELVLQGTGASNNWVQVSPSATATEGDVHTSTFSYGDMAAVYGASFADLAAINVCSTDDLSLTVTGLSWVGTDNSASQVTVLFSGEGAATDAWQTACSAYTTNWGGAFNPSAITEGGAFCIYYTAPSSQVQLVLQGTNIGWAQIEPSETREVDGGYISIFPYASLTAVYTDDMASTLGAVNAVAKEAVPLTVTQLVWYPAAAMDQIPNASIPEETEPETTVPEETEPETTVPEESTILTGTVLFSGEQEITSIWTVGHSIYTPAWGGSFSPSTIVEGGAFQVVYTGTPGAIELVLQDATNWSKVAPSETHVVDGKAVSLFRYEDLIAAYPAELAEVCAINIGSTDIVPLVLNDISWVMEDASDDNTGNNDRPSGVTLYSGSSAVDNPWSLGVEIHTTSSDGTFDPAAMNDGGYITVTYTGTEGQVYLALADWETGAWKQLDAPSYTTKSGDSYVSTFSFDALKQIYGDDFSSVDSICVGTGNANGQTVITNVTWYPGNPVTGDNGPFLALVLAMISVLGLGMLVKKRDLF